MKKVIVFFVCVLALGTASLQAQHKDWAIGLRLGDPAGLNIKKYFGNGNAFDFTIGNMGYFYGGNGYRYRDGYRAPGIGLMGNYVWQKDFPNAKGLQWYYGLGGILSFRKYYQYYDNGKNKYYDGYRTNVALGATGLIGLEYFIPKAPISIFLDAALYVEIVPAPFVVNVPVGVGGRFNF